MAALEKEREKLRQLQQLSERRRSILQEGNDTKNQLQTEYARLTDLYQAYVDELSKPEYHPEGEISVIARISFNAEKFDRFTGCFDRRGNINLLLGDLASPKGGYTFPLIAMRIRSQASMTATEAAGLLPLFVRALRIPIF